MAEPTLFLENDVPNLFFYSDSMCFIVVYLVFYFSIFTPEYLTWHVIFIDRGRLFLERQE